MDHDLRRRAQIHAALSEPSRLAIVDALVCSDRSPTELARRCSLSANLLTHHLDVLERAGLVDRVISSGDRRRRYVRLRHEPLAGYGTASSRHAGRALFVCTHNSARSQLAAALWSERTGYDADSAGTQPADRVHPGAEAAAARAGLDLRGARPRRMNPANERADVVVTVCDRAHEQLKPDASWWHWSVPDPVDAGTADAFDAALAEIDTRIRTLARKAAP